MIVSTAITTITQTMCPSAIDPRHADDIRITIVPAQSIGNAVVVTCEQASPECYPYMGCREVWSIKKSILVPIQHEDNVRIKKVQ